MNTINLIILVLISSIAGILVVEFSRKIFNFSNRVSQGLGILLGGILSLYLFQNPYFIKEIQAKIALTLIAGVIGFISLFRKYFRG